jgi:hypothetical protein
MEIIIFFLKYIVYKIELLKKRWSFVCTLNSVEDTKDIVFLTNVGFQRHSLEQREHLFQKLLNDHTPLVTAVKSTCSDFEVPKPQKYQACIGIIRNNTSANLSRDSW